MSTKQVVGLALAIKLFILFFAVQAYVVTMNEPAGPPHHWLEIWSHWDAAHYVDLVDHGYRAEGDERFWIVFFPGFPWMAQLFFFFTRDALVSAFLLSGVAAPVAALLFHKLLRLDEDVAVADQAVLFLLIFPTACALHIPMTESLFLSFVLGALLAARKEKWLVAGLLGAAAALTRLPGALLFPTLAVEALLVYRRDRKIDPRWAWLFLIGVGVLIYLSLNKVVTGDWLRFQRYQHEHWDKTLAMPWRGIIDAWDSIWFRPSAADALMVGWQELLFTFIAIGAAIWSWVRLRPTYAMWATLNVLLFTSTKFLLGAPRYTLAIFPIFIWFSRISEKRPIVRAMITMWSLLYLGLFITLFVRNKWSF